MTSSTPKRKRTVLDGVLLLDKPAGLSSNDALIRTKRLLNAVKAGHTGTLDPFATGLLPLCFGEATKFSQDLLEADKTYEATAILGLRTDTGDCDGVVVETLPIPALSVTEIEQVLAQFRGPIAQIPPMYSALKRDGKPLYEYARAGIELEREARQVVIHHLELVTFESPQLKLRVSCSKGTYIRVLAEDIGRALGCGAHLQALRRTQVGALCLEEAVSLDILGALAESDRHAYVAPVDRLLSTFEAVVLPRALAERFLHGQRITLEKEGIARPVTSGRVRVYCRGDILAKRLKPEDSANFASTPLDDRPRLIGTGIFQEYGVLAPERVFSTATLSFSPDSLSF